MSPTKKAPIDVIAAWTDEEIDRLELQFLHKQFNCDTPGAVDATLHFASFMSNEKLTPDNYPVFLKLLQLPNHWVADALLGSANPEKFFEPVQPNQFIVSSCFKMLTHWRPGEIYPKSLLVILGLLRVCYEHPKEGYRLYPLTVTDVNNLGKHLDEEQDQRYPLNHTILHLLDRVASLADLGGLPPVDRNASDVATQANNVRGKFLDATKHLYESIPAELLRRGDYRKRETPPSTEKKSTKGAAG